VLEYQTFLTPKGGLIFSFVLYIKRRRVNW